ncbi:MAG: hypothetical protein WC413_02650 [Candidatus Nanoarchaeia archaeon]
MKKNKNIIIVLVLLLIFISGCSIYDCGTDINCFEEKAKSCSSAKVNIIEEGNNIRLTSRGILFGKCKFSLKIEQIGENLQQQNPGISKVLIGKTMNCEIPLEELNINLDNYLNDIANLKDGEYERYCSGPIKDILNAIS